METERESMTTEEQLNEIIRLLREIKDGIQAVENAVIAQT
jgi:hypothetical protein